MKLRRLSSGRRFLHGNNLLKHCWLQEDLACTPMTAVLMHARVPVSIQGATRLQQEADNLTPQRGAPNMVFVFSLSEHLWHAWTLQKQSYAQQLAQSLRQSTSVLTIVAAV